MYYTPFRRQKQGVLQGFSKKSEKSRKEKYRTVIVSAVSLWKKFNLKNPLGASEWGLEEKRGGLFSHVSYAGRAVSDGSVRIYARFARPLDEVKRPVVLLLADAGERANEEVMAYFVERGYAVLMPDYSGEKETDEADTLCTRYPATLAHGNYEKSRGLYDMENLQADGTTWFEWTSVALYSVKYLKSRPDVGNIGVVGIRKGGELAWHVMLSPDVKCGVPVNAAGWYSFLHIAKFGDNIAHNLGDDRYRYIAAVEAQSYAPYVKCPVLMLCAMRDLEFDCDRAYDTYSRIGTPYDNALAYSPDSGACIGPNGLLDMELFLEKHLKGREIYIPDTLNVALKESAEGLDITVECDREGILEEAGIYYAEGDVKTKSAFRDWRAIYSVDGGSVKHGTFTHTVKPFAGAKAVFVYAYARYINGFRVMSKIVSKRLSSPDANATKNRMLFTGEGMDCFGVAEYREYSIGDIFLANEAVPKIAKGYGGIGGAYSVGGIKTYKISSPEYVPRENALLKFDVYSAQTQRLKVTVEVADVEKITEKYTSFVEVRGGGKWKRIILRAADFKGEKYGTPLQNFFEGNSLSFACGDEEKEFAITNILWL